METSRYKEDLQLKRKHFDEPSTSSGNVVNIQLREQERPKYAPLSWEDVERDIKRMNKIEEQQGKRRGPRTPSTSPPPQYSTAWPLDDETELILPEGESPM